MAYMGRDWFGRALPIVAALLSLTMAGIAQQGPTDVHGKRVDPLAAKGKPVVLLFLSTECPISNRYAPTIQQLAKKYGEQADFWLVYPGTQDSPQAIANKLHDYGYELPWLRDPDHALVAKAQATITPEAAVFDGKGDLQYHGRIDDLYESISRSRRAATVHDLNDAVQAVISGAPVLVHSAPAVGCYITDMR